MTQNDKLEIIRQKCIAANPEIGTARAHWPFEREIRLADVLLAIPHLKPRDHRNIVRGQAESAGNVGFMTVICEWNLRADDLREQSPETIEFLHSLLK